MLNHLFFVHFARFLALPLYSVDGRKRRSSLLRQVKHNIIHASRMGNPHACNTALLPMLISLSHSLPLAKIFIFLLCFYILSLLCMQ